MSAGARSRRAELRGIAEAALGHRFARPALLDDALDHAARIGGRTRRGGEVAHERLEFLGDRVLGLIIAEALLERFPSEPEGSLNLRLVSLVREETLAGIAREIGLDGWLRRCAGTPQAEAAATPTILADALEALIAALYLDGGLDTARRFVGTRWQARLDANPVPRRDAKTALQEWAQARGLPLPGYRLLAMTGPDHAPEFEVEVRLANLAPASGRGASKRVAEQLAAATLLRRLAGDPAP
jgi:ribonuclease-3